MNQIDRQAFIMSCVQEHYNELSSLGYEVVGVFLQGSQNYGCDEYSDSYKSDVDTKAIILPSFEDVVCGRSPFSHTHVRANDEHIDIKDIRVMFEMFRKQNSSYIELLFTPYKIINPKYEELVEELLSQAEAIAHMHYNQALRCLAGMSMEKIKALEHPYPSIAWKIEKWGYDGKQLHHIIRINQLVKAYIQGDTYVNCLDAKDKEYLIEVKKNTKYTLQEARELAKQMDEDTHQLTKEAIRAVDAPNTETVQFLEQLKVKFIRQFLTEELSTYAK